MTSPTLVHRRRSVPLAVLILAAIAAALLTVTTSSESAHASPADHKHGNSQFLPLRTSAQVSFHDQMRKLWEDHITWTRLAIVTFADGSNDLVPLPRACCKTRPTSVTKSCRSTGELPVTSYPRCCTITSQLLSKFSKQRSPVMRLRSLTPRRGGTPTPTTSPTS
jgi:hypothetical protein